MVNTTMKLKRATFKYIESELYGYRDTLREIAFLRKNLIYGSRNEDENIGGGRTNRRNRPTEQIATACMTNKKLAHLEDLADAIEHTYNSLEPDKQKLIRLKYWTRPQLQTWEGIAAELHVTKRTALRWRDMIVYAIAVQVGAR